MLLSPLGPRGKLRPEWEFDTELRAHSLAAGPGPVCGLWPLLAAALLSSPPHPPPPSFSLLTALVAISKDTWPNCQDWARRHSQERASRALEQRKFRLVAGPARPLGNTGSESDSYSSGLFPKGFRSGGGNDGSASRRHPNVFCLLPVQTTLGFDCLYFFF